MGETEYSPERAAFLLSRIVIVDIGDLGKHPIWNFSAAGDCILSLRRRNMKLNAQGLKEIVNLTLEHYNRRAEEFWAGTRDHDVSQNIAAMLQYIEAEPRFTILDLGCAPGRHLNVF